MINSNLLWRDEPARTSERPMPSASIVVPVWNGEKMLADCLNSVLKQDLDSSEIIIVDDGSTDRSLEIVKNAIGGKRNVRVIAHPTNLGLSKTLNEGIKEAKGDYVQIVHQDCEIIDRDYVRRAIASLDANPNVAVVTGRRLYELDKLSDKEKLFMVANGHLAEIHNQERESSDVTFTEHKCDLFRKRLVERIGGFPDANFRSSGEDQVLSSELRGRGYRLVRLGSISYKLGFGSKESTLKGIVRKLFVYGKTQAGVLLASRRSSLKNISDNKVLRGRAVNRIQMVLLSIAVVGGLTLSVLSPYFILVSLVALALRLLSYAVGMSKVRGRLRLALVGPVLDLTYSIGFLDGVVLGAMGRQL